MKEIKCRRQFLMLQITKNIDNNTKTGEPNGHLNSSFHYQIQKKKKNAGSNIEGDFDTWNKYFSTMILFPSPCNYILLMKIQPTKE